MARSDLIIMDSNTVLFFVAPSRSHYARCIEVKTVSFDECGIHITLRGPLYDMATAMSIVKNNQFILDIKNHPCGPPSEYSNKQTIILFEECEVIVQYIENLVRWIYCGDPDILEMYADITAKKATIYNYDSGEEILTWLDRN